MSKRAFLFPGQGAQAVGMGKDLAQAVPESRKLFESASAVLGFDLATVCFEGPLEALTKSSRAQPGLFVVSVALFEQLKKKRPGLTYAAVAGLSSGEWTALHIAGVLGFEDTLRVLEARGRFMQQACEEQVGTMTSVIGLDLTAVRKVAEEAGVEVANLNSQEQTVLSGRPEAIAKAEQLAKDAGAKRAIRLNVAGAFHSSLMASAAAKMEKLLADIAFAAPKVPVLSNVTGQPHGTPEDIRRLMVQQITSSVRWVDNVLWMKQNGITEYVECGSGKVLSGLVKRIDNTASLNNIGDLSTLEAVGAALT